MNKVRFDMGKAAHLASLLMFVFITACTPLIRQVTPTSQQGQTPQVAPRSTSTPTRFPDPTELTGAVFSTALARSPEPSVSMEPLNIPGAACLPNNPRIVAKAIRVLDEVTIEVQIAERIMPVRYIGLAASTSSAASTPGNNYTEEALEKNRDLVEGKNVILIMDISTSDGYGNLMNYVIAGDVFVNYELAINGYAKVVSYPPDIACSETLAAAESQARSAGLGLWSKK